MTLGILRSINHRNTMYKKLKQMRSDSENYVIKRSNFNQYRNTEKNHDSCKTILLQKYV